MNYELAKKLKDAGCPFRGVGIPLPKDEPEVLKNLLSTGFSSDGIIVFKGDENPYFIPTLSELIAECGVRMNSLMRISDGWQAGGGQDGQEWVGDGPTPEEAVANLYLALKKNGK